MRSEFNPMPFNPERLRGLGPWPLPQATIALSISLLVLGALPSSALDAAPIEGRWRTADNRLIIDIGRCGEEFCGRRVMSHDENVVSEAACERTVFSVKPAAQAGEGLSRFEGNLDLGEHGGVYKIQVQMRPATSDQTRAMRVLGWNNETPMMSRRLPLDVEMVRAGDAKCRPVPTS
jgi:uncharacterized protein (DUF2147 family)